MKKPLIGITLDYEESGGYSKFPWYAIRENYLTSLQVCNAIPFPIFHEKNSVEEICNLIDGLILTGGNFDIDPAIYGEKNLDSRTIKDKRTDFEISIFKEFFYKKKPILGICGGEQLINVACGGDLIQNIKTNKTKIINHEQLNPRSETSHKIYINNRTKLSNIIKKNEIMVNSAHHQAVKRLGKNLIVTAISEDNIIEAIEHNDHPWCIGVQWHPEFLITNEDRSLIKNFVSLSSLNL
ncbi:MAG: putative glutamine amidotransferase [Alphaproteobacteria bacterium MarineAlpha5_Bin5]|nr:MAG: putative glutamine amidotransferase [Alphaproteobacteria bacterium MarineAlpha5_Bin5]PPR51608.1 MAG: putative glutamine amidotransferase [Alphaproteobacteria bacterium MarineAlpha5_Bin4]|tara:strand:+ start:1415 stop:2131 length:717 start_codon:yes stop_codon:yes gene_type:complete